MFGYIAHLLRSIGRRRGFGVQSPTDYALIRYVLCESWPYYEYASLRHYCRQSGRGCSAHRLGCLLFRIANHTQAHGVFLATEADDFYLHYIHAGCHATELTDDIASAPLIVVDALRLSLLADRDAEARQPFARGSIIVAIGIHSSAMAETCWRQLQASDGVGTTFDMYTVGVALTDTERHPHHYEL